MVFPLVGKLERACVWPCSASENILLSIFHRAEKAEKEFSAAECIAFPTHSQDALFKRPPDYSRGRDPRQTRSMEDPNLDLQGTERFINQRGEGSHPRKLEGESGALVP